MARTTYGKWRIPAEAETAEGGQGFVYTVTSDEHPDMTFKLKVLKNAGSSKALERFGAEIRAIQKLDHPGIVSIIETGTDSKNRPFYVMKDYDGAKPLSEFVSSASKFRKNVVDSLRFVAACADALQAAHEKHIVHRDVKPDNILVLRDNSPVIIDFGCCLINDGNDRITLVDEAVGSRYYHAPECGSGIHTPEKSAADVYSLGKVLWSLISGKAAFDRERPGYDRNNELSMMFPDVSSEMAFATDVLLKSVRHDPADRVPNGRALAELCREAVRRIGLGAIHLSRVPHCCNICRSENTRSGPRSIEGTYPLQTAILLGNPANNTTLTVKSCQDCGHVSVIDTRPSRAYQELLAKAQ